MSRGASSSRGSNDANDGKLLHAIETISKALYLDKHPSKSSSSLTSNRSMSVDKPKHVSDDLGIKHKKSFWNWKPLKALTHVKHHVKHRRFNCCFTLKVHTVEGLPSKFNDLDLRVHWERNDAEVVTSPIKVNNGFAEFEMKLSHTCSISCNRNGHHSVKYDAKHFSLYAALYDNPKIDLGKHHVDLTRILPLTLEELEDGKSSGTWTTSFKLSGEAKGAIMNVTFGYEVLEDGSAPNNNSVLQLLDSKATTKNFVQFSHSDAKGFIRGSGSGSVPVNQKPSMASRSMDGINILSEVPPIRMSEFSDSINILYQKPDEENVGSPIDVKHEIVIPEDNPERVKYSDGSPSGQSEEDFLNESEDGELSFSKMGFNLEGKSELDVNYKTEAPSDVKKLNGSLSDPSKGQIENECENVEFSFARKGLDLDGNGANVISERDEKTPEHTGVHNDVGNAFDGEDNTVRNEAIHDCNSEVKDICRKESILEDLKSEMSRVAELEKYGMDTSETRSESSDQDNQDGDKLAKTMPSQGFDDLDVLEVEESSVSLSCDVEPESPRDRLLREFLEEAEADGCSLLASGSSRIGSSRISSSRIGFDIDEDEVEDYVCYAPSTSGQQEVAEDSDSSPVEQVEYPKIRAKVIEDLETEELSEEWDLDENAFQCTPHSIDGLGSSIDLPPQEEPSLPLGEGLGPFIQTKTGGFLRSVNPVLFMNAKNGRSLIMQVSCPVVVPAELGSGVMDILQKLASMGLEKLSVQAKKVMPLEDITGKTMQRIAWEAVPQSEASKRQNLLQNEQGSDQITSASSSPKPRKSRSSSVTNELDSEYVSLEDLVPLAMNKIGELSIEGLRIQSDMSDEDAPSNITAQSIRDFSALEGKRLSPTSSIGLEGIAGLQLLDLEDGKTDANDGEGLMDLSLTLDEWMRLDSGEIDDNQPSERISKLMAAHQATSTDVSFVHGRHGKASGRCGLLGNNFTIALMVQLHDPLRDYEPVGTPMLGLAQVERVFVPPNPRIYCAVAKVRDSNYEDDDLESAPKFKISEVHVSGLKGEHANRTLWGNAVQRQSGSRWLLANGMGKSNDKKLFMRANIFSKYPLPATITSQPGDTLWSISARYCGSGASCTELAALNAHIRNPDVILFN